MKPPHPNPVPDEQGKEGRPTGNIRQRGAARCRWKDGQAANRRVHHQQRRRKHEPLVGLHHIPPDPAAPDEASIDRNSKGRNGGPAERGETRRLVRPRNLTDGCGNHQRDQRGREHHAPHPKPAVQIAATGSNQPHLRQKQQHPERKHQAVQHHQRRQRRIGPWNMDQPAKIEAGGKADQHDQNHENRHAAVKAPLGGGTARRISGHASFPRVAAMPVYESAQAIVTPGPEIVGRPPT